jgi:hypothetical protein
MMGNQNNSKNRSSEPRMLTLSATDKYEIQVSPILQKWVVVVYELPDRKVITEDSFPRRETAVARAHDFRAIIVNRETAGREALGHESV